MDANEELMGEIEELKIELISTAEKQPELDGTVTSGKKYFESVVDPITKVKRIKCDLCDNTYSHHPALRDHRFRKHGQFPLNIKRKKPRVPKTEETSSNNQELASDSETTKMMLEIGGSPLDEFEHAESNSDQREQIEYIKIGENIKAQNEVPSSDRFYVHSRAIYQHVEEPFAKTKRIKCDLCDKTYSHHSALRDHRLRKHGKHPIRRKRKGDSAPIVDIETTTVMTDIDEEGVEESNNDLSNRRYKRPRSKFQSVVDPYSKVKRIKCDLCNNTYSHHPALRYHRLREHGRLPNRRSRQRPQISNTEKYSQKNEISYTYQGVLETLKTNDTNLQPEDDNVEDYNMEALSENDANDLIINLNEQHCLKEEDISDIEYNQIVEESYEEENQIKDINTEAINGSSIIYSKPKFSSKATQTEVGYVRTCGFIETSSDYKIFSLNCFYCEDTFPIWNSGAFVTHLKEVHQREEMKISQETEENNEIKQEIIEEFNPIEIDKDFSENSNVISDYHSSSNEDGNDCDYFEQIESFFQTESQLQSKQRKRKKIVRKSENLGQTERHCNLCNRTFKTTTMYRSHLAVHKPPNFKCHICAKEFRWRQSFYDHLKLHANQRDYVCELCGTSFVHASRLRDHRKVMHFDERNYDCKICECAFKTSTHLSMHRRKYHLVLEGTNEELMNNPYLRRIKNPRSRNYQIHEDPVTKIKRIKCDLCANTYSHHSALRYHRLREHNKLPIPKRRRHRAEIGAYNKSRKRGKKVSKDVKRATSPAIDEYEIATTENHINLVVTEDGEIIQSTDDLIIYDVTAEEEQLDADGFDGVN